MDPAKIREALGLAPDASDDEVKAALASSDLAAAVPPPGNPDTNDQPSGDDPPAADPTPAQPQAVGTVVVDQAAWDEREERIKRLEAADARRRRDERDQVIAQAVHDGKFPPNRTEHWQRLWDADPEGTRKVLDGLARNVISVEEAGYALSDDQSIDEEFAHLFPPVPTTKGA